MLASFRFLLLVLLAPLLEAQLLFDPGPRYMPPWAMAQPLRRIQFDYDPAASSQTNGAALEAVAENLSPGDRLEIGGGTYHIEGLFKIDIVATAATPIWIVAAPGEHVKITRSNAGQNVINVGKATPARFVVIQDIEFEGGSVGVAIWDVEDLWLDRCHIHDTGNVGISAQAVDTARLWITRNEVHDPGGTAEGIYLGSNNAARISHHSVIAQNHVHHTFGTQGEGIEVKQGSYANLIAENVVHDCNWPCIVVMGTGGMPRNIIERNLCYGSGDHTMQVQGEAIVRNNLLFDAALATFASGDHQGQVRDLTVVHNTMVNSGEAVLLNDWTSRPNMVFANNACYSQSSNALRFGGASDAGVLVTGNVIFGSTHGSSGGWTLGNGLVDFVKVTWNGNRRNARPSANSALLNAGSPTWSVLFDHRGFFRRGSLESGAFDG